MKSGRNYTSDHLLLVKRHFQKRLSLWYKENKRNLPWRKTSDPYKIWVSEVMLQQTQVKTVIPYYKKFIKAFPTVRSLARARLESVLKLWEGLGYYRRAHHLHRAAVMIMKKYRGKIPDTFNELITLPGFGEYTAGAVLSIAFAKPYPAVDGNVLRVFSRILASTTDIRSSAGKKSLANFVREFIPQDSPSEFNQAMMELGALVCTPQSPNCPVCPLKNHCKAFIHNDPELYPVKTKRKLRRTESVSVAVIIDKGRCLIGKRPPDVILPNLWEFPGGKVNLRETAEQACLREVKEETGLNVDITELLTKFRHHYSHYSVDLHFFRCRRVSGNIRSSPARPLRWIKLKDLDKYPFPSSTRRVIDMLLK